MEPIRRSAYAFCHGERGAVSTRGCPFLPRGPDLREGGITIPNEVLRDLVSRKRLAELLGGPCRRRMGRDRDVHDAASFVRQDDQHEEKSIRGRRHDEEVGRGDLGDLIREKRSPRLRGRSSVLGHVIRDRGLTDGDAELQKFTVNARRTPTTGWPPPWHESIGGRPAERPVDPVGVGSSTSRRAGNLGGARPAPSRA